MKNALKIQIFICASLICLGGVFGYIQQTYYGHVDEGGILHDSLFLPLSALSLLAAGGIAVAILFQLLVKNLRFTTKNESKNHGP